MGTINVVKQLPEADTPLLFFQCVMPSGDTEHWCTHAISFNGSNYSARVLKHNLFDLQLSADDAMDGMTQLSITLANADSALSQLNSVIGFKGSQLTVFFAFADLITLSVTTESTVLFQGVAGDPDEITEDAFTLSFINKLSLQRIPTPEVRIQRSCPWTFPADKDSRAEALNGGSRGRYSPLYRCGYSADISDGVGNLNAVQAYTSCNKSRADCQARGMFSTDGKGNTTQRFGGFEFVPSAITVRTAGSKTTHLSPLLDNTALYNDAVPLVYGAGWLKAPVIFARNDGNLTHMEALVGLGPIAGFLKVVVNDVEIPQAVQGQDMTATGWYNIVTTGTRSGNFNLDFTDANRQPLGDPYGSMSVLSVVVPNRISSGRSLADVEVLMQGQQLDSFNSDGSLATTGYTNNPAWVILDLLRRSGWSLNEMNLSTFAAAAAFCQELINTTDLNGNPLQVPRYECNLIITKRQSVATVVRGIRVAASLMLRYGATGLLELLPETTLQAQQPNLPDGSNSTEMLDGGWPAYEFSDGSGPFSGIMRDSKGASTVRLTSRSIIETSNRLTVEFQDENNEYQQDSLSLVNSDDSALIGYEISSHSTAMGIANFSQATRVLLRQLDKLTDGNVFVQFQTSFRALKIRPGDLITLTYFKEGFTRTPFRVVKLSPSMNYQTVLVTAQIHNDAWYSDNPAVLGGAGRQPAMQIQTPRPLIGIIPHLSSTQQLEFFDFQVQENILAQNDGTATDTLTVGFSQPIQPAANTLAVPLLSLSPEYQVAGGTLPAASTYYYAVSAVDSAGNEGPLSFTVSATTSSTSNTNSVSITDLSFPVGTASFNVYRGATPQMLYRIAAGVSPSATFLDNGLPPLAFGPPDASFDHANFYYRYENAGPFQTTASSSTTITCSEMGATNAIYSGMVVRIIEGRGRGQERTISTNDQATLTVSSSWSVLPDTTSIFVIADASWRFAAVTSTTPAQFEIPYRTGDVIQISGRGANVNNLEGTADLCPLTRWPLGQSQPDLAVPPASSFQIAVPGGGEVVLYEIGFENLTNTSSISSGTLQLYAWNELEIPTTYLLAENLNVTATTLFLNALPSVQVGTIVQIDAELISIQVVNQNTNSYQVVRGALGSVASAHAVNAPVLHLTTSVITVPFAANFFENRASVNYIHTVSLPDLRICAAEFAVTNSLGSGAPQISCYSGDSDGGLRTLSGGQFSLQVSGPLATQQNAAPPLTVEASHAVRDIRATVNLAPSGYDITVNILQDGNLYCSRQILSGNTTSDLLDGVSLPPLIEGSSLSLNVTLNLTPNPPASIIPGKDLTVTIRL
ncbi:MAG TPA: phage tail protein [Bryobacteraceae bacterium]|nr:phage tail protein [Bryobacteraceae bacterium]